MNTVPFLPEDILRDILRKLPRHILLRFKTVCKAWLEIISDPILRTVQMQCNSVIKSWTSYFDVNFFDNHRFILVHNINKGFVVKPAHWTIEDPEGLPSKLLELRNRGLFDKISMVGNCHGVFLLYEFFRNNIGLLKFTTGEYMTLCNDNASGLYRVMFGELIEEDGVITDLFVLKLYATYSQSKKKVPELYTLSTRKWNKLKPLPEESRINDTMYCENNVSINGVFYWMPFMSSDCSIIAFDSKTETVTKIYPPQDLLPNLFEARLSYYSSGGKKMLSIIGRDEDIWIMKECGVWTKEPSSLWSNAFLDEECYGSLC